MTIIYISIIDRVLQLCCIDGLSGVIFEEYSLKFGASPESIVESNGQEISVYFLSRTANKPNIHTANNKNI